MLGEAQKRACETPARIPAVPCWPQLPVATEYRRPRVMVSLFTAAGTFTSLPRSTAFCVARCTHEHHSTGGVAQQQEASGRLKCST